MSRTDRLSMTLCELALRLEARLVGCGDAAITGVNGIEAAGESDITFLSKVKNAVALKNCRAAAVLVPEQVEGVELVQLVVANVERALISALGIFARPLAVPLKGIDPSAQVHPTARIDEHVSIGPCAVIGPGAIVGPWAVIASGVVVGEETVIGENCRIDNNVVIYHRCRIGNNVWIQANCTIGSTGFGYSTSGSKHILIPHNGGVVIEDFVDIGANACVDRAKFGDTIIGAGTKIDNLVHIAHNVVIGKCCLIAAQVGIAGSCTVGDGVVMAGQVGLKDHIRLGKGTMVGGQAGVHADTADGDILLGSPATDVRRQFKQLALIAKLPQMAEQLKTLAKRIEAIESEDDKKRG